MTEEKKSIELASLEAKQDYRKALLAMLIGAFTKWYAMGLLAGGVTGVSVEILTLLIG